MTFSTQLFSILFLYMIFALSLPSQMSCIMSNFFSGKKNRLKKETLYSRSMTQYGVLLFKIFHCVKPMINVFPLRVRSSTSLLL